MKVAVIGASGFTGEELVSILLGHPKVEIAYISAKLDKEVPYSELFSRFKGRLDMLCAELDIEQAAKADIIFLALPHKISQEFAPAFIKKGKAVIDLSADYRFKDPKAYEEHYKFAHKDPGNLAKAVYGLPEFYAEHIKKAQLLANPGCYPTVSILSLAPLLKEGIIASAIIDAKSGITGAGRRAALEYHYAHLNGNLFCYKPFGHQHLPEINAVLSDIAQKDIAVRFSPHVIPAERGILVTAYAELEKPRDKKDILDVYDRYYKDAPFVRVSGSRLPQLKDVVNSNFCDIGFELQDDRIVVVGAIDNLVKGASGQAVQNMNIMLGWDQTLGLI
jgi:N-acetyl-gamma-glutamyl-phosphate reductase